MIVFIKFQFMYLRIFLRKKTCIYIYFNFNYFFVFLLHLLSVIDQNEYKKLLFFIFLSQYYIY